jgi:hypothetical protein
MTNTREELTRREAMMEMKMMKSLCRTVMRKKLENKVRTL